VKPFYGYAADQLTAPDNEVNPAYGADPGDTRPPFRRD